MSNTILDLVVGPVSNILDKFIDTIGIFPNAVSDELCDEIIEVFKIEEKNKRIAQGVSFGGLNHDIKRTWDCRMDFYPEYYPLIRKLRPIFKSKTLEYINKWNGDDIVNDDIPSAFENYWLNDKKAFIPLWQIQKYEKGLGHYNQSHLDEVPGGYDHIDPNGNMHGKPQENTINVDRMFVLMLYLNDIEEGGTTEFIYPRYEIKPKKGTFVIWPAGWPYVHKGNSPISSDKYILTTWYEYEKSGRVSKVFNEKLEKTGKKHKTKPVVKRK